MAYGKIENNTLVYVNASFVTIDNVNYVSPSAEVLASFGIYPVENVAEDGTLEVVDGVIKNYIGKPTEADTRKLEILTSLDDTTTLMQAIERLIASQGVTAEDKQIAQDRLDLRSEYDELGKVVVTDEGDGTVFNPYQFKVGKAVEVGMWYKTESGYIWECIKSGYPTSELDAEYFDVIGV